MKKLTPRKDQLKALDNILNHENGLLRADRVQYISACGTGKTPVLLWSVENYLKSINNGVIENSVSVFLFPSLTLINQSYDSYKEQNSINGYRPFVVCSDDKVTAKENEEDTVENCSFPVSTNQFNVEEYLKNESVSNKVIFSTYKSAHLVGKALKNVGIEADITVYDEAHRTAVKNDNSERVDKVLHNSGYSLDNKNFPSKKRLFATATPRHYSLRENFYEMGLTDKGNVAYSMDNPRLFGKIAHEYAMREAISDGVITDYKILAITVSKEDVMKFLNPTVGKSGVKHFSQDVMESAAKILAITSASEKYNLKSALVFNSTIEDSKEFIRNFEAFYKDKDFNIGHIDGSMDNETREKQVNILKKDGFSLLSNAKLLSEGHDLPQTDFVVFNNKIESKTDIVQRVGRAQRLDNNNPDKVGYILLPIFIDDVNQDLEEALRTNSGLQTLFNTVNSLKESDTQLRDWISTRKKIREERKDGGKNIFDTNDKVIFTDMAKLRAEIEQTREQRINDDKKVKPIILDAHKASEKEIDLKYQEMIEKWEDKVEATLVGERWQLEEAWNNTFDLVKEYYEANGKLPSQTTKYKGVSIGHWINGQKKAYKNNTLESSRVEKLLELDVEFFVTKDLELAWNNNLALLYKHRESGEKLTQETVFEGKNIGSWAITVQKRAFTNGTLSHDKVAKLLEFDSDFFKSRDETLKEIWNNNLALVKEYYKVNGKLPSKKNKDLKIKRIGEWIVDQKKAFTNGTLSHDKVAKLLEFDSDFFKSRDETLKEIWNNNLALLYKHRESGEKLTATTIFEGKNIGSWAITVQKRAFTNGTLSHDKVAKLLEFDSDFFGVDVTEALEKYTPKVTQISNASQMPSGINNKLIDTNDERVKAALALKETVDAMVNKSSSALKVNSNVDTKDTDDVKTASAVSNTVRRNRR